jgi:hypothetical protein
MNRILRTILVENHTMFFVKRTSRDAALISLLILMTIA